MAVVSVPVGVDIRNNVPGVSAAVLLVAAYILAADVVYLALQAGTRGRTPTIAVEPMRILGSMLLLASLLFLASLLSVASLHLQASPLLLAPLLMLATQLLLAYLLLQRCWRRFEIAFRTRSTYKL